MTKILDRSDKYRVRAAATRTDLNFRKFEINISRGSVELQWRLKKQYVRLNELYKVAKDRIQFAPCVQKLWQNYEIRGKDLILVEFSWRTTVRNRTMRSNELFD